MWAHKHSFMHTDSEWPFAAKSTVLSAFKAINLLQKTRSNWDSLFQSALQKEHCRCDSEFRWRNFTYMHLTREGSLSPVSCHHVKLHAQKWWSWITRWSPAGSKASSCCRKSSKLNFTVGTKRKLQILWCVCDSLRRWWKCKYSTSQTVKTAPAVFCIVLVNH